MGLRKDRTGRAGVYLLPEALPIEAMIVIIIAVLLFVSEYCALFYLAKANHLTTMLRSCIINAL
jgi:hypothetical protein